jgi:mRNA interferase MazF
VATSLNIEPRRGEIWDVNFDPTVGAEIQRERPALVVSSDAVRKLPLRLVAPVTSWKDGYRDLFWHVRIDPDSTNGLTKTSSIDAFQLRSMSLDRFARKRGWVKASTMAEIAAAIAAIVEYQ